MKKHFKFTFLKLEWRSANDSEDGLIRVLQVAAGHSHRLDEICQTRDNFRKVRSLYKHSDYMPNPSNALIQLEDLVLIEVIEPFDFNDKTGIDRTCLVEDRNDKINDYLSTVGWRLNKDSIAKDPEFKSTNNRHNKTDFGPQEKLPTLVKTEIISKHSLCPEANSVCAKIKYGRLFYCKCTGH